MPPTTTEPTGSPEESGGDLPSGLADLTPSAKLAFIVLRREGPLCQDEVCERTRLPSRTAREALSRLREAGLVTARPDVTDARRREYRVRTPEP